MTKPPKPPLTAILVNHPRASGAGAVTEPSEAPEVAAGSTVLESRMRVVVRLNVEAVEALEDITRELRRQHGKAVPTQKLMEEAVEDLLRKYGRPAVVLPAPAKRGK